MERHGVIAGFALALGGPPQRVVMGGVGRAFSAILRRNFAADARSLSDLSLPASVILLKTLNIGFFTKTEKPNEINGKILSPTGC